MDSMMKDRVSSSFPFPISMAMHDSTSPLYQDLAIRRFCRARVLEEEERGGAGAGYGYDDDQFRWELLLEEEGRGGPTDDDQFSWELLLEEDELGSLMVSTPTMFTSDDHTTPHCPDAHPHDQDEYQFVDHYLNMDLMETETQPCEYYDPFLLQAAGILDSSSEHSSSSYSSCTASYTGVPSSSPPAVEQGLQLVHLLLACAEAVGCRDTRLATSILSQIWYSANPWGDSLQRVSYCFAMGLQSRLSDLLHNLNSNGTLSITNTNTNSWCASSDHVTWEERIEAFHLLHQTTPYIAFGIVAANEAISRAAQGKDYLHIVDIGMRHTLQWQSLINTLASRPGGPPKLVRITGITELDHDPHSSLYVEQLKSGNFSVEIQLITGPVTPSSFTRENLKIRGEEAVFVNSMLQLHTYVKESRGSLKAILTEIKKLGPALMTVVEQDANHNGPFFIGRFLESLHYYSAIFDSMEASQLARNSEERMKIEKHHFAEEIRNIVACEGAQRIERHERADQWRRQLGRAGFQVVAMKGPMEDEARKTMVGSYDNGGYTVGNEKGCLLLGWKGRPIMLASAWQLPPT